MTPPKRVMDANEGISLIPVNEASETESNDSVAAEEAFALQRAFYRVLSGGSQSMFKTGTRVFVGLASIAIVVCLLFVALNGHRFNILGEKLSLLLYNQSDIFT